MLLKQVRSLASSAVSNVKAHHMIDKWRSQLKMHGICDFDASANHLVQHVCKSITKTKVLTLEQVNEINEICYKRCQRIPTQYLIGEWPFRDTSLILKPPVFIPRPETEVGE
jgi:release factor glutamine methyltransferase